MTGDQRLVAWGDELVKLHDTFRRDLAALRAALASTPPAAPPSGLPPALDLRTHCLAFCDALHAHHEGEDNTLFPHLAAEHPGLAEVLTRLRAEHQVVARLLNRIRVLLDEGGAVTDEVHRLSRELEAHLDHEEEHLVPVLNRMTTLPDDI
ncbi:hemerythrin domain-containing protein [Actinomadura sp. ATCC 31491]|uniref:Hemerythrin domain-containing protein n=1 Tax=Actinomadura luzonensis TaxID=2805427 RepID=A0ABT0G0B2_9ACTN|nr:hemerythrin domain-containing protein [Actinomadura luzonensis]MCK2217833.1 hemerythrin domain-containing protein [Actinomadura luzonensis]